MLLIYGVVVLTSAFFLLRVRFIKGQGRQLISEKTYIIMKKLHGESEAALYTRMHNKRKYCIVFTLTLAVSLIAVLLEITSLKDEGLNDGSRIERNEYGEGEKEIELIVGREGSEETRRMSFSIGERRYDLARLDEMADSFMDKIDELILSGNPSRDFVSTDLSLLKEYPGYPFSCRWRSDRPLILSQSGEINKDRLKDEDGGNGVLVTLYLTLSYYDYVTSGELCVCLYAEDETEGDFYEILRNKVKEEDDATATNRYLILPDKVNDELISYRGVKKNDSVKLFLAGLMLTVYVMVHEDGKLREEEEKREEMLIKDYPVIINKYALYLEAGMSSKKIWSKICDDYRRKKEESGKARYAYEEMQRAEKAMNEGVGEVRALNDFAIRCSLPQYRLFASMIEQGIKRGRSDMCVMLTKESMDAFADRKMRAKIMGEKAGTKLLIPMFMMLMVVLFIVMVPAFTSFGI